MMFLDFDILPDYEIFPRIQAVYEGRSAYITCYSSTFPIFSINGKIISSDYVIENTLTLHNVQEDDSGPYMCSGSRYNRTFIKFSDLLVGGMY